jgi:hypothetical protein
MKKYEFLNQSVWEHLATYVFQGMTLRSIS